MHSFPGRPAPPRAALTAQQPLGKPQLSPRGCRDRPGSARRDRHTHKWRFPFRASSRQPVGAVETAAAPRGADASPQLPAARSEEDAARAAVPRRRAVHGAASRAARGLHTAVQTGLGRPAAPATQPEDKPRGKHPRYLRHQPQRETRDDGSANVSAPGPLEAVVPPQPRPPLPLRRRQNYDPQEAARIMSMRRAAGPRL